MSNKATKFHPILFSTPMVQAISNGTKTQTRRTKGLEVINDNLDNILDLKIITDFDKTWVLIRTNSKGSYKLICPYHVGDVLWVREKFAPKEIHEEPPGDKVHYFEKDSFAAKKWKPSIFMPKEACRIFLKVKSIRIERLQEISEEDAKAEGAKDHLKHYELKNLQGLGDWTIPRPFHNHQFGFLSIWCTINGCDNWKENPYIFAYEFEKIEKPLDFIV